jgi:hypothetical protein
MLFWVYTLPKLGSIGEITGDAEWCPGNERKQRMGKTLTLTFAVVATATMALAADNTLGTWKLNSAKSKPAPPAPGVSPITNLTLTREAIDGGAKITVKGETADGSKIDAVINAKYDGTPVTVMGTSLPFDTVAIKQVNANTLTETRTKKGGKYHVIAQMVVSADGKTMTVTQKGTDAEGKPITATGVWDKQ